MIDVGLTDDRGWITIELNAAWGAGLNGCDPAAAARCVARASGPASLAPAASFILLNTIEGQFVTPALVGKHMAVNPLLVFLALIVGIWLWGPIGGIVAIPLLLWGLVLSDSLAPRPRAALQEQGA